MFKFISIIALLSLSLSGNAETYTYVDDLKVLDVYAGYEEGNIFFGVDKDVVNPNECSAGGQRTIGVDPSRGNIDHVLSILLYAQAAEKNVSIQVYDSSCIGNHIVIRRIKVSK